MTTPSEYSLNGDAQRLRIHVGEADRVQGRPLYETLLLKAREQGLAGATVLRGVAAYGAGSVLHTAKVLRLSEDLPLVIEIVDAPAKIAAFQPLLGELIDAAGGGGLVTLEPVQVLRYHPRKG